MCMYAIYSVATEYYAFVEMLLLCIRCVGTIRATEARRMESECQGADLLELCLLGSWSV